MNPFLSASELLRLLKNGQCTALDLLEMYLDRIDRYNPELNAVVWQDKDEAIAAAKAITQPPDNQQPLRGLPMTIKESYNLSGAPTTWGIPHLKDNVATEDSVVAERLKAAGAIIFGKTNVPLGLMDYQSYNDVYGTSNNPWNTDHTPGGSSGGSAAALAAGLTALEMGSDIAGSIRTPAHFCGLFGHKPTYSLIPARGHATPGVVIEPDIGVTGPMGRSADDLQLLVDVLAGPDALQTGVEYRLPKWDGRQLADLRVAIWANETVMPVNSEIESRVHQVAQALRTAGAYVNDEARPELDPAHAFDVYQYLLWSFISTGLPDDVFDAMKTRSDNNPDADDYMAMVEKMHTIDHRSWVHYHNEREKLRWAWHDFFQDYDIVIAPQTPTTALKHEHSPNVFARTIHINDREYPYYDQFFWSGLFSVAWLPSTVIPTGLSEDGLPIGVQIVGNAYNDDITIGVAQALEQAGFVFEQPPGYGE